MKLTFNPEPIAENVCSSDSVADGEYVFNLQVHARRANILDYFYFVDGSENFVTATGGTVKVELSPLSEGIPVWQDIADNTFNAADAALPTWLKPNGLGRAGRIRFTLAGITGAAGFRAMLSQSET